MLKSVEYGGTSVYFLSALDRYDALGNHAFHRSASLEDWSLRRKHKSATHQIVKGEAAQAEM